MYVVCGETKDACPLSELGCNSHGHVQGADRSRPNKSGLTAALVAATSQITLFLDASTPFDDPPP